MYEYLYSLAEDLNSRRKRERESGSRADSAGSRGQWDSVTIIYVGHDDVLKWPVIIPENGKNAAEGSSKHSQFWLTNDTITMQWQADCCVSCLNGSPIDCTRKGITQANGRGLKTIAFTHKISEQQVKVADNLPIIPG